ncbi:MAG: PQQ-dependent sugar dehydrogenase [Sphingomonadaceae bacterium]
MTRRQHIITITILLILALVGAGWFLSRPDVAQLPFEKVQGAAPKLIEQRPQTVPTINVADVIGWKGNTAPVAGPGLTVKAFADGLDHPRWLYELPNGDVLVAESTAPERPISGVEDYVARNLIAKGTGASKSANRITLLRDTNGDGVADQRSVLISGLNSPFGMALIKNQLYVANTDSVMVFPYQTGDLKIASKGQKLFELPAQLPNNHWARNLIAAPDGSSLYVTIGSNSNIGENGMASEKDRAQIKQYVFATKSLDNFANGMRNPNGMAFNPISGTLWATVNERDMLGSDGPPDYLTAVDFGAFFGWPDYYWGRYEDSRVKVIRKQLLQYTRQPDYALGPHVAALGLAFSKGPTLGANYARGAFVAMHGSWNRVPASGYKVIYVPFNSLGFPEKDAKPADVLTGFLTPKGDAQGRPAGLIIDKTGALLVADDSGNRIWRVTALAQ